jgi:hypothetical protein
MNWGSQENGAIIPRGGGGGDESRGRRQQMGNLKILNCKLGRTGEI